ncbi:MAG: endonuclease/exonuclease/phosphatase family protein [Spirochaetaceae bacterium]|nr:endonuclease/exonuclease/phosphatase family protein [Spirochaetaceae bacterium]
MKKIFCTALVLLVTFFVVAEEITILSFNIKGTSTSNRQGNTEWLNDICNIISNSQADIVLLQEVCIELKKYQKQRSLNVEKKTICLTIW